MKQCPTDDQLIALAAGSLETELVETVVHHYLNCRDCQSCVAEVEIGLLVELLMDAAADSSHDRFKEEPELHQVLDQLRPLSDNWPTAGDPEPSVCAALLE